MGDIDDAHDAEGERQPQRRQRQRGGGDGAFKNGEEEMREEGQGVTRHHSNPSPRRKLGPMATMGSGFAPE